MKTQSPTAALKAAFADSPLKPQPTEKALAEKALQTALVIQPTTDEARLNGLEKQWLEVLRSRRFDWLGIQPMGLKLADNCRYHPDFMTLENGLLTAWETKGFMRDDAALKLKIAARNYPFIRFVLVTKEKKQWIEKEVKP